MKDIIKKLLREAMDKDNYVGYLGNNKYDDVFDEIGYEYFGMSSKEFDNAISKSGAEIDYIEKVYMSDVYTNQEKKGIIATELGLTINEDKTYELGDMYS